MKNEMRKRKRFVEILIVVAPVLSYDYYKL